MKFQVGDTVECIRKSNCGFKGEIGQHYRVEGMPASCYEITIDGEEGNNPERFKLVERLKLNIGREKGNDDMFDSMRYSLKCMFPNKTIKVFRQGTGIDIRYTPFPLEIHSTKHRRTTSVKWSDGTYTTVRASKDDKFSVYSGFTSALMKKIYGHTKPEKFKIIEHEIKNKKEKGEK